jgi:phosphate transport system substrate-binding protein
LSSTAAAETIKLGGTGSMIPMVTDLANAYMKKHPADKVEVNQKSMGQPGGIAALNAGAIDIAMSGMRLTGEQAVLPIKAYEIAKVAGVVAVTNDVPVSNISSQQLCDIYAGKLKNWKQLGGSDSTITVLTRPESDTTKMTFRRGFACMTNLKEGPDVMSLSKSSDMFNALETKKSAIGIVDSIALSDAAGKFKALKVDGISYEQYESGKWPYGLRNHLVVRIGEKKEAVKRFLEFVKTAEAQAIIRHNKAKPVFNLQ